MAETILALEHMHNHKVIYRDLKVPHPQTIIGGGLEIEFALARIHDTMAHSLSSLRIS